MSDLKYTQNILPLLYMFRLLAYNSHTCLYLPLLLVLCLRLLFLLGLPCFLLKGCLRYRRLLLLCYILCLRLGLLGSRLLLFLLLLEFRLSSIRNMLLLMCHLHMIYLLGNPFLLCCLYLLVVFRTVGGILSFFIAIILSSLLFPAWSIAWICIVYSPSSVISICFVMSFWWISSPIWWLVSFVILYTYPSNIPAGVSSASTVIFTFSEVYQLFLPCVPITWLFVFVVILGGILSNFIVSPFGSDWLPCPSPAEATMFVGPQFSSFIFILFSSPLCYFLECYWFFWLDCCSC